MKLGRGFKEIYCQRTKDHRFNSRPREANYWHKQKQDSNSSRGAVAQSVERPSFEGPSLVQLFMGSYHATVYSVRHNNPSSAIVA